MWSETHASPASPFRQLVLRDILVLRDLVRFGVLANDQIERRYGDPALAADRLPHLVEGGLIEPWSPLIQDTAVYSATAAGARVARCGLRATRPSLQHLRHDVAVVDLADYILEHEPRTDWRTEREAGRFLRTGDPATLNWGLKTYDHKPDGLLLAAASAWRSSSSTPTKATCATQRSAAGSR